MHLLLAISNWDQSAWFRHENRPQVRIEGGIKVDKVHRLTRDAVAQDGQVVAVVKVVGHARAPVRMAHTMRAAGLRAR